MDEKDVKELLDEIGISPDDCEIEIINPSKHGIRRLYNMTYCFPVCDLVSNVARCLYYLAPNGRPRKADIILEKLQTDLEKTANGRPDFRFFNETFDEMLAQIRKLLMSYQEFRELNLTQNEYDAGINVDDENRPCIRLTYAGQPVTEDSWKDDFIDLDAFMQNFACHMESSTIIESLTSCDGREVECCTKNCLECTHHLWHMLYSSDQLADQRLPMPESQMN